MKYLSVLFTIIAVWLSVVVIAAAVNDADAVTQLHHITLAFTVVLFLIGFGKGR